MVPLYDIQNSPDTRNIPISRVGIKDFKLPVKVMIAGKIQQATATISLYTDLEGKYRGTHMSRFIALLTNWQEVITTKTLKALLADLAAMLQAKYAEIELSATVFLEKKAPVSKITAPVDYKIGWRAEWKNGQYSPSLWVLVPATSLCPCSKEISAYGAHNQRSLLKIDATYKDEVTPEELITLAEKNASCELYSLLKRPDEKFVTEWAYDHPKFVEDIVRDIYQDLRRDARITRFKISSENFESIHNHSAFAEIIYP